MISGKVARSLTEIVEKGRQIDTLVAEVAGASREQSQGVQQINEAVVQMDRVVQSNAASADETARALEQLNAQASMLKDAVNDLQKLVGGAIVADTQPESPAANPGVSRAPVRRAAPRLASHGAK